MAKGLSDLDMPEFDASGEVRKRRVIIPLAEVPDQELECDTDGDTLSIEGDIVVFEAPRTSFWKGLLKLSLFGHSVDDDIYLWPSGVIPYVAESAVRELVEKAIEHWERRTPIRFRKYESEKDYVAFQAGSRNRSAVGRQGNKQIVELILGTTCGWAIHEIGHVVGLWHEHSRSDQDAHIEIHWENIKPGSSRHFEKQLLDAQLLGSYDFDSAMHYPETAFTKNGKVTISRRDGKPLGPRTGLSKGDIEACMRLYSDYESSS